MNLELKNYAAISQEYARIDRRDTGYRNAFYNEKMRPYLKQFDETDTKLDTVIFSHLNDMQIDRESARIRAEFIKFLLWRYPNQEDVSILPKAEFAEFQEDRPELFRVCTNGMVRE